ncbi:hypothetical protein A3718_18155 [Erythrobacter sp. HI0019]|nr:hypothetical protein A3718_18155 [Erythrobacter sp. HI0019]
MACSFQRIVRMKFRGHRVIQIFEDDRGFEDYVTIFALLDQKQRHLAERRYHYEPVGLLSKIDVAAIVARPLLAQGDGRPLHIGAEVMAHQCQISHVCRAS